MHRRLFCLFCRTNRRGLPFVIGVLSGLYCFYLKQYWARPFPSAINFQREPCFHLLDESSVNVFASRLRFLGSTVNWMIHVLCLYCFSLWGIKPEVIAMLVLVSKGETMLRNMFGGSNSAWERMIVPPNILIWIESGQCQLTEYWLLLEFRFPWFHARKKYKKEKKKAWYYSPYFIGGQPSNLHRHVFQASAYDYASRQ